MPAASTVNTVLFMEPNNTTGVQLREKVQVLESHLDTFEDARKKKDWALARLALDKCLQVTEGEGGEIPTNWKIWKAELEVCRRNWDSASAAAKQVF